MSFSLGSGLRVLFKVLFHAQLPPGFMRNQRLCARSCSQHDGEVRWVRPGWARKRMIIGIFTIVNWRSLYDDAGR